MQEDLVKGELIYSAENGTILAVSGLWLNGMEWLLWTGMVASALVFLRLKTCDAASEGSGVNCIFCFLAAVSCDLT